MFRCTLGASRTLTLHLVVLGALLPAIAQATISLDTTTYAVSGTDGSAGTGSVTFSGTSGDVVFLAISSDCGVDTPTMTGQSWTYVNNYWPGTLPIGVTVWYTVLSSSGGTIPYNIESNMGDPATAIAIVDAFSGVTSVDSSTRFGRHLDLTPVYNDITPSSNNSLIVDFACIGSTYSETPTAGTGFTETSEDGIGSVSWMHNDYMQAIDEYSTGNPSGTQVDVQFSTPEYIAYGMVDVACH